MKTALIRVTVLCCVGVAVDLAVPVVGGGRQQPDAVAVDDDDVGGIVIGPNGPEAGVWVIAETFDLPTRFVRIVVTDDHGRYVVPDLPDAWYDVWVRGYGLVDSPKIRTQPGRHVTLTAVPAPDPAAAAHYYPAGYWFSLIEVPSTQEFPGTGTAGNASLQTCRVRQRGFAASSLAGAPRVTPSGTGQRGRFLLSLATSDSLVAAWSRRIQSGQAGGSMTGGLNRMGRRRALEMFADWTDRIVSGELPPVPPRPQGVERNIVVTQWDWADPKAYLHDEVSTDKRNPRVNANGPIYGALEASADFVPLLDPVTHTSTRVPVPVRDPETPRAAGPPLAPSPYWGEEAIWESRANVHNPMLDEYARVWLTSRVRPAENPAFCREGSSHPSAQVFPTERSGRHLAMYDPETAEFALISTCFSTHHLVFAEDEDNTIWTSGGGQVIGWLNTKMYDETGDEAASQGWTPLILDTNGNGRRDEYVEPGKPLDPTKDVRVTSGYYGVAVNPLDGTIWGSSLGFLVRSSDSTLVPTRRERRWSRSLRSRGATQPRRFRGIRRAVWISTVTGSSGRRWPAGTWRASTAAGAPARSTVRKRPGSIARRDGHSIQSRSLS